MTKLHSVDVRGDVFALLETLNEIAKSYDTGALIYGLPMDNEHAREEMLGAILDAIPPIEAAG